MVPNFSASSDYASVGDYMQAALQSGVSLTELNDVKRESTALAMWKKIFLERLLMNDLTALHGHKLKLAVI